MCLWKKFRNTDIIGKIYILIILFIIVVAIITVVVRKNKDKELTYQTNNINEIVVPETEEILVKQPVNEEEMEEVKKINQTQETSTTVENIKQEKKILLDTKTTSVNKNNSSNVVEKIEETKENTENLKTEENKEESNVQNITENNNKQEEIIPTEKTQIGAEYVINNQMISTIKTFIENNPSDFMQTYGYSVVVDSSIKELTNPFTYTETRLKPLLNSKFGTIRIYAEDYYYDGKYVTTNAFVL